MSSTAPKLSFVAFCRLVGLMLTAGQTAFAGVAFDGLQVAGLGAELEQLGRLIFGAVESIPDTARAIVVQVKGRDAGGSRLGATRGVHLALTADLSRLEREEPAYVLFVAPKIRLARVPMRFARTAAKRVPGGVRIVNEHLDGFTLVRHDGRSVIFECVAASRGGDTTRGVPVLFALLDEAAFFRDETSGSVNDKAIFSALVPRLLPGGQILVLSSPYLESGVLYEEFSRNHGQPRTALAAHCPTLVMRDDAETRAMVERERLRDPDNARREFDAEFMPAGSGLVFDPAALRACVDESLPLRLPPTRTGVVSGFDFGPLRDATAGAVVRFGEAGRIECAETFVRRPAKNAPLVPSVVVGEFCRFARAHGAREVHADHYYRASVEEHVRDAGLVFVPAPAGNTGVVLVTNTVRDLVHSGWVVIPGAQRELISQLGELAMRPLSGGGFTLHSPRRFGSHGDLARAWMLAVFALYVRSHLGTRKWEVTSQGSIAEDLSSGGF